MTYLKQFFRSRREKEMESQPGQVFLVIGLGNPGREYRDTRHNIGFLTIDQFAHQHDIRMSRVQNQAIIGIWNATDRRVILAKPQTYMNLSGQAVSALAKFYKVPAAQILVIHDDVDLPFDTIRMRPGGGSAGQKGVKSIIEKLGTQEFPRLRMGIGRPPGRMDAASYVLQTFIEADRPLLQSFLNRAVQAVDCFLTEGLESAMNKFNPSIPEK